VPYLPRRQISIHCGEEPPRQFFQKQSTLFSLMITSRHLGLVLEISFEKLRSRGAVSGAFITLIANLQCNYSIWLGHNAQGGDGESLKPSVACVAKPTLDFTNRLLFRTRNATSQRGLASWKLLVLEFRYTGSNMNCASKTFCRNG
jgi:hypothetical protein